MWQNAVRNKYVFRKQKCFILSLGFSAFLSEVIRSYMSPYNHSKMGNFWTLTFYGKNSQMLDANFQWLTSEHVAPQFGLVPFEISGYTR